MLKKSWQNTNSPTTSKPHPLLCLSHPQTTELPSLSLPDPLWIQNSNESALNKSLNEKTSNPLSLTTWPTLLTNTSPTTSFPPSLSYNNTNSWSNKLRDSWTETQISLLRENVMPHFTTFCSLMPLTQKRPNKNRTPPSPEPCQQDSPPTVNPKRYESFVSYHKLLIKPEFELSMNFNSIQFLC